MPDRIGVRTKQRTAIGAAALVAMLVTLLFGALSSPAGAEDGGLPDGTGTISIEQGPIGPTGFCLPSVFALSYVRQDTPTAFILTITASPSLCEPVDAVAAIYAMPIGSSSNFDAWPQTLATRTPFTIAGPGTTTITFTKGCLPAQFDVIAGDKTPPKIDPWGGPFHGPLLFWWPYNIEATPQWFGGECGGTGPGCDDYTPTNLAVEPSSVAPGDTITVSGNGYPGTEVVISFQQPPGAPVPTGVTVTVPEDGKWSVEVTVPEDLEPGKWQVVAGVEDCEDAATADITVTNPETQSSTTTTTTTSSTVPAEVGGSTTSSTTPTSVSGATTTPPSSSGSAPLPPASVAGTSATNSGGAGLAYTGSSVRVPVLIGIGLLVAGTLLVLQRRRRS